jgi:hypothetical protein
MAMARATSVRIESSSSAISTRGIELYHPSRAGPHGLIIHCRRQYPAG